MTTGTAIAQATAPRWPVHPITSDRWLSAATGLDGSPWIATRREWNGISRLVLYTSDPQGGTAMCRHLVLPSAGDPDRAAMAIGPDGTLQVIWNEVQEEHWRIRCASVGQDGKTRPAETLREIPALCLPPAIAGGGAGIWAVWAEAMAGTMRIMQIRLGQGAEATSAHVSEASAQAARPAVAVGGRHLLTAWDQYREGAYEIVWQLKNARGDYRGQAVIRKAGSHCLGPSVTVDDQDVFYLAYQERTDVMDPHLHVFDHRVVVNAVRIDSSGASRNLHATGKLSGPVLDLSPGLLAGQEDTYRSYDGYRRRPQITVTEDQRAWLCSESRRPLGNEREGELRAMCLQAGEETPLALRHTGGVSYAVPPRSSGTVPWAACIPGALDDPADYRVIVPADDLETRKTNIPDRIWISAKPVPKANPVVPGTDPMAGFSLYWFDLHAHSSRSPDAEGDPDELLHYGRDMAALDGMAVMDNDYYPHKVLAEAEWRMENELASLYNEEGRFLVFPAYEFTFFDEALTPSINHRTVIYRRPGGSMHRCIDPGSRNLSELVARLPREDVLLLAHHGTWQAAGDDVDGVEVCSSWRVCIEEMDFVEQRLLAGDRFAFLASSDSHRACPGLGGALTGVFARELTRDAIFEALKARRTIATQGQRIDARLTVGSWMIGQSGVVSGPVALDLQVKAPLPLVAVEVIRDEKVICRIADPGAVVDETLDDSPGPGCHHYRVRILTEGDPGYNIEPGDRKDYRPFEFNCPYGSNLASAAGPFAWTTPVWVEVKK